MNGLVKPEEFDYFHEVRSFSSYITSPLPIFIVIAYYHPRVCSLQSSWIWGRYVMVYILNRHQLTLC